MELQTITLATHDSRWRCVIAPQLGAACVQLQARGPRGCFGRPADFTGPAAIDPFETASFALLPYSNRIADGVISALRHGDPIRLPRNDERFVKALPPRAPRFPP